MSKAEPQCVRLGAHMTLRRFTVVVVAWFEEGVPVNVRAMSFTLQLSATARVRPVKPVAVLTVYETCSLSMRRVPEGGKNKVLSATVIDVSVGSMCTARVVVAAAASFTIS